MKVRHLLLVMEKYLMRQIKSYLSTRNRSDQKATDTVCSQTLLRRICKQKESLFCSGLVYPHAAPLKVGLLSLFSEEGKRHRVFKTSKENCEVARIGSWKQYHIPHVLLSVSVLLQSVFLTLFFPSSLLLIKLFSACKRPGQLVDSQNLRPEESTVSH